MDKDIYIKLRPPLPTDNSDICKCVGRPSFVLQSHLTYNPISCADCNLEVDFSKLHFTSKLVDKIVDWRDLHDCFYKLWVDSDEFENLAIKQLSRPNSSVNKKGLLAKDDIKLIHDCFYWWFTGDTSAQESKPFTQCPNCSGHLIKRDNKFNVDTYVCKICDIIVAC